MATTSFKEKHQGITYAGQTSFSNFRFQKRTWKCNSTPNFKGEKLKEHITKIPTLLICISGQVSFENEQGLKELLSPGDYIHLEAMVKHWVEGIQESQLLLIK